jgi:SPP1 family predicted phage head-tail adaptor
MALPPRLREVITIEQNMPTRDAYGAAIASWTTYAADVPAAAQPIGGREFVAIAQAQADLTIRFRCRYIEGVNNQMRVQWRGNYYGIVAAVNWNGRDRELELLCRGEAVDA